MSNSIWNSSSFTNFFYPNPLPADHFISDNVASGHFPTNTNVYDICYNFPGGFNVCTDKKEMVFAWDDPDLAKLVNRERSPLPDVAQPKWVLTGFTRWAMTHLPIPLTIGLPKVTRQDDQNHGHQYITLAAMTGPLKNSLITYLGSSFPSLPELVSNHDVPVKPIAELLDLMSLLLANIGGGDQSKHALRSYSVEEGPSIRLDSQAETQAKIRHRIDQHLSRLGEINQQLPKTTFIFKPTPFMQDIHEQLAMIESARKYGDHSGALYVAQAMQGYFEAGQMSIFTIPNRDAFLKNPEAIIRLTEPHIALKKLMDDVLLQAEQAEKTKVPDDIAKVVATQRLILMYFSNEHQSSLAIGEAALKAERDNNLSGILHTVEDSRAHCNSWTKDIDNDGHGDVCTESVGVNLFGRGPRHDRHDDIEGEEGQLKLKRAIAISERVLSLSVITDKTEFNTAKEKFLNDYWPTDTDYSDNFLLVYNTGENNQIYIANSTQ